MIPIRIIDLGHNVAQGIHHGVVPLAVEFKTNWARLLRDISGALQILGDGYLCPVAWVSVAVGGIDLLQEFNPFIVCRACRAKRANVNCVVEPQSIDAVVAEQQERVVVDVLPDLGPAVVRPRTEAGVGTIPTI